jgi:hypothetical protein
MKKLFVLSMLIPFAMVCSSQKQDAAAEQQLAQRKAELDTCEKALGEREKALAEREKAVARAAVLPADLQLRALKRDASSNAKPSASIPPGLSPPDNSQLKASRERRMAELRARKKNGTAARYKTAQVGGNTENEMHGGTTQFRCRDACRHERVSQHHRLCQYQHVCHDRRGSDFTISVVYAPVNTRC